MIPLQACPERTCPEFYRRSRRTCPEQKELVLN